eukprot:CAMPEP_0184701830 /NCGR_PEP_ID=MMETSP0313-20130426/21811_1 /TAXON_ID=2792 /ORGANISM="Porphyridium aerugineum, Strain SAG 1380-2" /LENGTH=958 /DNA_ID=CAMNT_0027162069 /DNA_START=563 /DNA_END=3439 /DNA_ORIENTATION=+
MEHIELDPARMFSNEHIEHDPVRQLLGSSPTHVNANNHASANANASASPNANINANPNPNASALNNLNNASSVQSTPSHLKKVPTNAKSASPTSTKLTSPKLPSASKVLKHTTTKKSGAGTTAAPGPVTTIALSPKFSNDHDIYNAEKNIIIPDPARFEKRNHNNSNSNTSNPSVATVVPIRIQTINTSPKGNNIFDTEMRLSSADMQCEDPLDRPMFMRDSGTLRTSDTGGSGRIQAIAQEMMMEDLEEMKAEAQLIPESFQQSLQSMAASLGIKSSVVLPDDSRHLDLRAMSMKERGHGVGLSSAMSPSRNRKSMAAASATNIADLPFGQSAYQPDLARHHSLLQLEKASGNMEQDASVKQSLRTSQTSKPFGGNVHKPGIRPISNDRRMTADTPQSDSDLHLPASMALSNPINHGGDTASTLSENSSVLVRSASRDRLQSHTPNTSATQSQATTVTRSPAPWGTTGGAESSSTLMGPGSRSESPGPWLEHQRSKTYELATKFEENLHIEPHSLPREVYAQRRLERRLKLKASKEKTKETKLNFQVARERAIAAIKDIRGSTAARCKTMTEEEHKMMLYKRKIRNRESAERSREKQRLVLQEINQGFEADIQKALHLLDMLAALDFETRNLMVERDILGCKLIVHSDDGSKTDVNNHLRYHPPRLNMESAPAADAGRAPAENINAPLPASSPYKASKVVKPSSRRTGASFAAAGASAGPVMPILPVSATASNPPEIPGKPSSIAPPAPAVSALVAGSKGSLLHRRSSSQASIGTAFLISGNFLANAPSQAAAGVALPGPSPLLQLRADNNPAQSTSRRSSGRMMQDDLALSGPFLLTSPHHLHMTRDSVRSHSSAGAMNFNMWMRDYGDTPKGMSFDDEPLPYLPHLTNNPGYFDLSPTNMITPRSMLAEPLSTDQNGMPMLNVSSSNVNNMAGASGSGDNAANNANGLYPFGQKQ